MDMVRTFLKSVGRAAWLVSLVGGACHPHRVKHPPHTDESSQPPTTASALSPPLATFSPQPAEAPPLFSSCAVADAGLAKVAERFGQYRVEHGRLMKNDEL